jgi:hypothetical protein
MSNDQKLAASFRDPSGFLFRRQGVLYRQINTFYQGDYELLMNSGLYEKLVSSGMLVPHEEVNIEPADPSLAFKVIKPDPITFISYPYEWCFSQLKDAALTTLAIQKTAIEFNISLKDSSAYNIQFHNGKPTLIDSLSFEAYRVGEPWVAYRQFCQHFLAPLALMAHRDVRLGQLLRVYIDGVPLDLASRLLPRRTRLDLGLNMHIHLHATAQKRYANKAIDKSKVDRRMSRVSFQGLIDNLESTVNKLGWKPKDTEWGDYYPESSDHYTSEAFDHKRELVAAFVNQIQPKSVWDLGANTGLFSRIASDGDIPTVAYDIDVAAVELNYQECSDNGEKNLLPLVLDLTNPSPGQGWASQERMSFVERAPVDVVMALALIHHLAISNNVPLPELVEFFYRLSKWLIIEFVPKEDSQVQLLLATREDIFSDYNLEGFQNAFSESFNIHEAVKINNSQRVLFLMEAH